MNVWQRIAHFFGTDYVLLRSGDEWTARPAFRFGEPWVISSWKADITLLPGGKCSPDSFEWKPITPDISAYYALGSPTTNAGTS